MKSNTKTAVKSADTYIVLPLLVLALASNLFLYIVAYSNASFAGAERPFPAVLAPSEISQNFDYGLTALADNISWSVSNAADEIKPAAVAFLGLQDYKFGQARYTSIAPEEYSGSLASIQPQGAVLGLIHYYGQ